MFQLLKTDRGSHWRQVHVETAPFYTSKEVDHLIKDTEVSRKISHSSNTCTSFTITKTRESNAHVITFITFPK